MSKEKQYCNVKAITRIQRTDGMPSATLTITNLMVNNDLNINPTKNGNVAMSFPSNLALDDFTKSRLSHALNGMTLTETQYGVPVKVVSFVKPGGRYDQLAASLEKGAKITLVQGTLTPKNYVNEKKEIVNYLELNHKVKQNHKKNKVKHLTVKHNHNNSQWIWLWMKVTCHSNKKAEDLLLLF